MKKCKLFHLLSRSNASPLAHTYSFLVVSLVRKLTWCVAAETKLNFHVTTDSKIALTTMLGRNSFGVNSCEQHVIRYDLLLYKQTLEHSQIARLVGQGPAKSKIGISARKQEELCRRVHGWIMGVGKKHENLSRIINYLWASNLEETLNNRREKGTPLKDISQNLFLATPVLEQWAHEENSPTAGFLFLCVRSSYCPCWTLTYQCLRGSWCTR